jgi:taurine dioxygenase
MANNDPSVIEPELRVVRLTGYTGVAVDVDLRLAASDPSLIRQIKLLAGHNCVTVFRGQNLAPQELARLGTAFGGLYRTPGLDPNTTWPDVYRVDNPGKANALTEDWHTDGAWGNQPPSYTILAASVLPAVGGDTLFLNQYVTYDSLSEGYKRILRGLRLRHIGVGLTDGRPKDRPWPECLHPMVRMHPETGRRALYVNVPRLHGEIEGFSKTESQTLIEFLYSNSQKLDRMYRHRWEAGDVLLWDNRCTLHSAAHDYGDAPRSLYRVMVVGETPIDGPYPNAS